MKNTLTINHLNSGSVDLVNRLDTGTNEFLLEVTGGSGAIITFDGSNPVSVTSDDFIYNVNSSLWVGTDALSINISDGSLNYTLTVNKIDQLTGDIYINQVDEYEFTFVRGSGSGGLFHQDIDFETWQHMTPEQQADGTEYFVWNGGSARIPLDYFYPIGSIYMSVSATNPSLLFGGTWEKIEGKFLLGSSNDYGLGNEGGEATHTLTVDEIPAHKHSIREEYGANASTSYPPNNTYSQIAGNNAGTKSWQSDPITNTGGGQPHNNMPPYLVVNIWKRTA